MTGGAKLVISDLSMRYDSRALRSSFEVLRGVELSVLGGEFVSIVGASGCGKTTLLRCIDGLLKVSSGTIRLDDRLVTGPGPDRSFVFQSDSLLPWRTLIDNVTIGLELQHHSKRDEQRRLALEYIALVGLRGFESHYPDQLSGGMRQRANLARALVVDPEVLLMDEPFASLDAQTREIMQGELLRIWNSNEVRKKTVLFVTHQIDEAVYLSDRVVVMSSRPGTVREEIRIDLPRPRDLSMKRSVEFSRYTDRIWRLIESEVRDAISRELKVREA